MTTLLLLLLVIGLTPLVVGNALLKSDGRHARPPLNWGSLLLCALAFNLTFFWQELWLVIPKALTPGLHPILYHNNHLWTGHAPSVDLLQATGALATLFSGLVFSVLLAWLGGLAPTWRWFIFWMAFQGLFQSLTQLAIGTMLPGADVGRALTYLHLGVATKGAVLALDAVAMAIAGTFLARQSPWVNQAQAGAPTRAIAQELLMTALLATVLIIPFRLPRDVIEVALIPLFVNLTGAGWLSLGAALVPQSTGPGGSAKILGPAVGLGALLLLFQFILRPGLAF